ncbi:hypothetical protein MJO28_001770 [Puccinia striiformis f. sp. tritici]|uniref:Uncharacterized protein n=1 Tax=Puccinia striiformis f. sp. tritici TaxID=168172 RepID=A0ACC0EVZ7_9BASI|nr:hypothetical protein MJO28_001770 [Puccinia striiformis f. sp. tritici]
MVKEVEENVATYSRLQGVDDSIQKIVVALKVAKISNWIPPAKWLNKMDHQQIMSNTFARLLVHGNPGGKDLKRGEQAMEAT